VLTRKSQKLYGEKTATKHNRTGIISGYAKLPNTESYRYIAPWIYNDNCDTELFNTWLKQILIPEVKTLQKIYPNNPITFIMDNVAYHKSQETKDICIENNINLKFQPPYSPDLNPIEPSWDTTKNNIRSQLYTEISFQEKLFNSILNRTWYR